MARIRFRIDPRDVPAEKVARLLHLTPAEFHEKEQALYDRGFPKPDPTTGMFDMFAVDAWMDARHPLTRRDSLTDAREPRNAQEVFGDRARRLRDG